MLVRYNVTAQQFVEAWESSNTVKEVVDKLQHILPSMPEEIVKARAELYAINGVILKKLSDFNPYYRIVEKNNQSWFK